MHAEVKNFRITVLKLEKSFTFPCLQTKKVLTLNRNFIVYHRPMTIIEG